MCVLWLIMTFAVADPGEAVNSALPRAAVSPEVADKRDLLLLLDDGPLHLRINLALGGTSLAQARKSYIDRLMKTLDADGDGKLTRKEAARSPLFRTKSRPSANSFLEGLQGQAALTRREVEQRIDAKGSALVSYHENLSSSKNDLEVFKLLDRDGSGVLDAAELVGAADLILSKDTDGDQCVSFEEFFPPPPPPDPTQAALGIDQPITQLDRVASLVGDVGNALFRQGLVMKKYDRNRDMQLDARELGWPPERIKPLDKNGDGKLNAVELGRINQMTPDAEMSVDLQAAETGGGLVRLEQTTGKRLDDARRTDYAKVSFQPAVVTFSQRNVDPQAAALDDAMRKFNSLDVDANGYLTRDETADRLRFERELFELIDADGDQKIFAEEMKQYVLALSEPAAATCFVNLHDAGYGFFLALDANADGRVSEREKRQAGRQLAALDRDGVAGIRQNEPVRHFHLEFARGTFQLFGAIEQPTAQAPTFQRQQLAGPIWFQRMDRNNDGDLIWNEFLGPRWVFDQLVGYVDELLDPQEAARWRNKTTNTER
jgi:Ca2+-binding EF-hand superfamily protein